jgi:hypothetical protein
MSLRWMEVSLCCHVLYFPYSHEGIQQIAVMSKPRAIGLMGKWAQSRQL